MVSPKGLNWDRENENYRTISENEDLRVFRLFSDSNKNEDKEKTGKSFDFSGLVDYTGKISNLLEDIRKVEKFVQYFDNQGSENITEKEGSQKQYAFMEDNRYI